jgi:hypothetical protein
MKPLCHVTILGDLGPAASRGLLANSSGWARLLVPRCSPGSARGPPYRRSPFGQPPWRFNSTAKTPMARPKRPGDAVLVNPRVTDSITAERGPPTEQRCGTESMRHRSLDDGQTPPVAPARRRPDGDTGDVIGKGIDLLGDRTTQSTTALRPSSRITSTWRVPAQPGPRMANRSMVKPSASGVSPES